MYIYINMSIDYYLVILHDNISYTARQVELDAELEEAKAQLPAACTLEAI